MPRPRARGWCRTGGCNVACSVAIIGGPACVRERSSRVKKQAPSFLPSPAGSDAAVPGDADAGVEAGAGGSAAADVAETVRTLHTDGIAACRGAFAPEWADRMRQD